MAQAPIPPASVVRFNTLCATCHEGECSARLSFRLDPGATDSHIRRYTGDISLQAARQLNALLEHMKLNCGYYAIDLPSPKDGRWRAELLQQLHAAEEKAYFVPLGTVSAGRQRFTLTFEREAVVSVQLVSAKFEITEQPLVQTQGGQAVVVLEAEKPGEYYLRLHTEQPARLLALEKEALP
ncbi:MAG: hypothetical protein IT510_05315 [Sulfuritalea sp.]|nr:hypothetical protein [Sulfuritalea sp.]